MTDSSTPRGDAALAVALGEYDIGWHEPKRSLAEAERIAARAAEAGAQVVVLPEMATTGFTMDRMQAVSIESADVDALRAIARRHRVWLIAGVALRSDAGGAKEANDASATSAVNAALAIDPNGEIVASHRKQRLFAYSDEEKSYVPGAKPTVITIGGVRVALFICYELRFPELFGAVVRDVDAMVLIANWPASRQEHWDVLLRARAVENQCYVIGVNRVGRANGLYYTGGSAAYDPWGARLSTEVGASPAVVTIDAGRTHEVRRQYPFLRDRG